MPVSALGSFADAAQGLGKRQFKVRGNCHDFPRRLHLCAQQAARIREFVKRPLRNLDDHIVQGRLKAGTGLARDVICNLVEGVAKGKPCADFSDRISGCLGRKSRRTGDTGVHFNYRVFKAVRVQSELAVTAAYYTEGSDNIQRGSAKHLVFPVGQCQRRGHDNRITRVNADRIDVFHRAHGDHIPCSVPHRLKLDFLPAGDTLLHQHLTDG